MYTKQSWIHDGKMGERSLGHFDCECGRRVQAGYYDRDETFPCECGITYDGHGWIIVRSSGRLFTESMYPEAVARAVQADCDDADMEELEAAGAILDHTRRAQLIDAAGQAYHDSGAEWSS